MRALFLAIFVLCELFASALEPDSAAVRKRKAFDKIGWSFGVLPTATYNSDVGFEYGVIANLYDYGSIYPNYRHLLYFDITQSTSGSGIYRAYYETDSLIGVGNLLIDLSYLNDKSYPFYGFNGYDAVYNENWEISSSNSYRNNFFYKLDRNYLRIRIDFTFNLPVNNVKGVIGVAYHNFKISSIASGQKSTSISDEQSLFDIYKSLGLLPENEQNGGEISTFKCGIVFDSRKVKTNPAEGIWSEVILLSANKSFKSEETFSKFAFTYRQYYTLIRNYVNLATRLGYQTTITGHAPFYYEPLIETPVLTGAVNEGLGGSKYVRGVKQNRIIGEGVFYGTIEMRYKVIKFRLLQQNFYAGLNSFLDFGTVADAISMVDKLEGKTIPNKDLYFRNDAERMHYSTGLGLKFAMNENFVISTDLAFPWDKQDGKYGLYVSMNYLF